ncbi:sulfotransferase family protein [Angustibacter sp. McL0619]|uniref:sulfotransferase family protein n=1 Tax=Angustibacter sp. McL0619 TaxID=3415676 RepID=UPI003CF95C2C
MLAGHPDVSGFSGTGVKEDEGQHLQSVYPAARRYGGPGRFARDRRAHLTESSSLATSENARTLIDEWQPYWDLSRRVLVEKTPGNLVTSRFLQAMVPDARFVMIVRHPVVVTLSTSKWARGVPLERVLGHWFAAHELLAQDAPHLRSLHLVKYEDLVRDPVATVRGVTRFLGLSGEPAVDMVAADRSQSYRDRWTDLTSRSVVGRTRFAAMCHRYEERALRFGYSLRDLDLNQPIEPF